MSDLPTRLRAGVDPSIHEYEFARRGISEEAATEIERLRALIQDVEYECCEHCRPGVRHFLNGRYQSNKQS
jgi:hypothetical protein